MNLILISIFKNMKINTYKNTFFFILLLFTSSFTFAQLSSQEVDKLVEDNLTKFNTTGIAVGIVKDGKIIYAKGFGVKSLDSKRKVDKNTSFGIGSNSKAFTTAALAILVDEGKLNWTDKVTKYIPEFKMYNSYVTDNFTIEDLLTHRSGLGLGIGDLMIFPDGSNFTTKDIITSFQYFKPTSAFRTKFDYDNLLYLVAGEVIARVSDMSWEDYVQTNIIDKLGMKNSFTKMAEVDKRKNIAQPHSSEKGDLRVINTFKFDPKKLNGAAGSIYSSVNDMSKWMIMHLNHGKYNTDKILFTEQRQAEMWRIHTVKPSGFDARTKTHFEGYGLGWFLKDVNGNIQVSHTGGMPGMLSKVVMIPDLNFGIVILTNTSPGGAYAFSAITQTAVDSYTNLEKVDWTSMYYQYYEQSKSNADSVTVMVWDKVDKNKNIKIDNENFIGTYKDDWFGDVEIFMKENKLWFKSIRSPKLNGPMEFYNANTFAIKWEFTDMDGDAFAMFSLDENGKAIGIKMKGISPNIDFSYDFHDLNFKRIE